MQPSRLHHLLRQAPLQAQLNTTRPGCALVARASGKRLATDLPVEKEIILSFVVVVLRGRFGQRSVWQKNGATSIQILAQGEA